MGKPTTNEHSSAVASRIYKILNVISAVGCLLALQGCQVDWYSKTSLALAKEPDAATDNILSGVAEMWRNCDYGSVDSGVVKRSEEIPPRYWSNPVKALHPIKVYCNSGNFIIVQKIVNGREYGKYVMPPYSSHIPQDDFILTPIGVEYVFDYQKKVTR